MVLLTIIAVLRRQGQKPLWDAENRRERSKGERGGRGEWEKERKRFCLDDIFPMTFFRSFHRSSYPPVSSVTGMSCL